MRHACIYVSVDPRACVRKRCPCVCRYIIFICAHASAHTYTCTSTCACAYNDLEFDYFIEYIYGAESTPSSHCPLGRLMQTNLFESPILETEPDFIIILLCCYFCRGYFVILFVFYLKANAKFLYYLVLLINVFILNFTIVLYVMKMIMSRCHGLFSLID